MTSREQAGYQAIRYWLSRRCGIAYPAHKEELLRQRLTRVKRAYDLDSLAEIAIRLNEMLTKDSYVVVPLVDRGRLSAASNSLGGVVLNTWDTELWNAENWFRVK